MRALLRAAVLLAVSAWGVAAWAASKPVTPAQRAKIERQSAAEAARAKTLKAQAAAAARAEEALKVNLAGVQSKAAETKAAAIQAESDRAALETRRLSEAAAQAHDQRALELTLIALLQGEAATRLMPTSVEDERAGAVAALALPPLADAVTDRRARIAETQRLSAAKGQEHADLLAAHEQLAMQQETQQQLLADKARERLALLAESDRAAKRAAELGRQAHSLRELADRASAPRTAATGHELQKIFTGPRIAPADGRVIVAFGAKTPAGAARGITLVTRAGASVVAPASATVAYAGAFRSYGQVVILDLGGGSALVLTGLHSVLAQPGKKVALGEVVGEMTSASAPTAPELYFEVRQAGRTVDPERWLKAKT